MGGYNPIRWDCEAQGCWNAACRPNIEYFAHCFPRKIGLTDLDGFVELNSHFLILEWKSYQGEIPTGQRLAFVRLTALSPRIKVVIIAHEPKHPMDVTAVCLISNGCIGPWEPSDIFALYDRIGDWAIATGKVNS